MSYGMSGSAPGEADSIRFFFDDLSLERVEADKIEGWDVWSGRIAYSHTGYQAGANKTAIATSLMASDFKVIDESTGEAVLNKKIDLQTTHLGTFQVMDFSELTVPGNYILQAGEVSTHPFSIGPNVWESSIWKALNFFYSERCGIEIPGVHGECHRDWVSVHGDKRIVINGGWHDAGDLTQGLGNTSEIDYGLFALAERLRKERLNPELNKRVLEEATWGLDWIIKTSFGDGFRSTGSISSRRTNGIMGDFDDIISTAKNNPLDNFMASAAEAIGARVLRETDPRRSALALKTAEMDWHFGIEGMAAKNAELKGMWTGTFDSDNIQFLVSAEAILAAVDLWKITGNANYELKATEMARTIIAAQQQELTGWKTPMNGFFYADSAKAPHASFCTSRT